MTMVLGVGAVVTKLGTLTFIVKGTALGLKVVAMGDGTGRPSPRPSYNFLLASSRSLLRPPDPAELGGVELVGELLQLPLSLAEPSLPSNDPEGLPERAAGKPSPAVAGLANLRGEGRIFKGEMAEALSASLEALLLPVEMLSFWPIMGGEMLLLRRGGEGDLDRPTGGLVWVGVPDGVPEPRRQERAESDLVGPAFTVVLLYPERPL